MRNVFDQYDQPENKLTHALVTALAQDQALLKSFLRRVGCKKPKKIEQFCIVEQTLVGELDPPENEAERRGLPDGWIYGKNNDDWCLLIESKIESKLTRDQLDRHFRTAERCGFTDISVLAIEATPSKHRGQPWWLSVSWSSIYEWLLANKNNSKWAGLAASYFEIAERKFTETGYLKEGNLTVFTGIPFSDENPYNYAEAKRLIKLVMTDIRKDKDFCRDAKIDPKLEGRGAITGSKGRAVWDYLSLKGSGGEVSHTGYPHFTLGINQDGIHTAITIPNSIRSNFRKNIKDMGYDQFEKIVAEVLKNMAPLMKKDIGFTPWCVAVQRHYPSQRSTPILDAKLEFDMRTAFSSDDAKVKTQQQWLKTAYDTYCTKRSNYQLQIGSNLHYSRSKLASSKEVLTLIQGTWKACRPFIDEIVR
jgi:hypothetical protein